VLDRQRAGIDLLAVVLGQAGRGRPAELLEGAPQPADPPVGCGLVQQAREQVATIAGHLVQEPGFAAAARQVAHQRDGQQLGVAAARGRPGPGGMAMAPAVIRSSTHLHIGEEILCWQHGGGCAVQRSWTTTLLRALGPDDAPAVGERLKLNLPGAGPVEGVVDYVRPAFLGLRTSDALYRFHGRIPIGLPIAVAAYV
jgi:hypothetical protein